MSQTLTATQVLNGQKFSVGDKIVVNETKFFTVGLIDVQHNPVSGDVDVFLSVDYSKDGRTGTDYIHSNKLSFLLKY